MNFDWNKISELEGVESTYVEGFQRCLDRFKTSFDTSLFDELDTVIDLSMDENLNFGKEISAFFVNIRAKKEMPHMALLLTILCRKFGISVDHKHMSAAMTAAVLMDIKCDNPYHNNYHFFEVVCMVICLSMLHNDITRNPKMRLMHDDLLLLFISASIHDFAHDGNGNIIDGIHMPSRLEKRSMEKVKPFLIASGLSDADFKTVEMLVVCTDASRNENGRSPAGIARDIFLAHEHDNISIVNVDDFYQPILKDKKLSLMSVLLGEADISLSSGLNYEFSKKMTKLVAGESSVLQPTANTLYGFMTMICHGGYSSRSAQLIFGQNFQAIMLEAEHDSDDNVLYA